LDLDLHLTKIFGLWLDLDWVLKNQDWIRIAKFDSPLISVMQLECKQKSGNGMRELFKNGYDQNECENIFCILYIYIDGIVNSALIL